MKTRVQRKCGLGIRPGTGGGSLPGLNQTFQTVINTQRFQPKIRFLVARWGLTRNSSQPGCAVLRRSRALLSARSGLRRTCNISIGSSGTYCFRYCGTSSGDGRSLPSACPFRLSCFPEPDPTRRTSPNQSQMPTVKQSIEEIELDLCQFAETICD